MIRRKPQLAAAGPALQVLLFSALLAWTWRRWPDPLVDAGQQLYNAWQLAEGKILYRDIGWAFGPLSQHLNAAWFRLTGASLMSLVTLNLCVLAAITVMVNRIVSAIAGQVAAAAAGLVFLGVFAFGQYLVVSNYNYVMPYAADATHGMALSLAGLLLLLRHGRSGDSRSLAGIGAALGLLLLNKPEFFVALLAGSIAGLGGMLRVRRAKAAVWLRGGALLAGGAALPVAVAWVLLAIRMGPGEALSALLTPWETLGRSGIVAGRLYQTALGFDSPAKGLLFMLRMLGWHAAVVVPSMLVARWCRPVAAAPLVGLGVGAVAAALLWAALEPVSWLDVAAPLPLELLGVAIWAAWRLRAAGDGADAGTAAGRLAVAVFSLALLGKILLSTQVSQFGFVLAMPAAMVFVSALVGWVPDRLDAAGGCGIAFRCIAGAILAVFVVAHWRIEKGFMDSKVHQVGEGTDRFWADRRGENINAAVSAVRSYSPEGSKLFVVPEGTIVNYLARRENPGPIFGFLPNGFVEESEVVRMLGESRPAVVVVTNRPVEEFGSAPLGFGYGRRVMSLINREYRLASQLGGSPFLPGGNGIAVMVLKDSWR